MIKMKYTEDTFYVVFKRISKLTDKNALSDVVIRINKVYCHIKIIRK